MIITRITRLQDSFRYRLSEWVFASILFSWGWTLLLPYPTFSLPSMGGLAAIAPENVWGLTCLIIGGVRISVLAINGAWVRSTHGRAVMAFVSCFVWCQISLGLISSGVVAPGGGVYVILLAADVFNTFKAASEAREIDDLRRRNGNTARR